MNGRVEITVVGPGIAAEVPPQISEQHGGGIDTAPGRGTAVTLWVPLAAAEAAA